MPQVLKGRPQKLVYAVGNIGVTGLLQLMTTYLWSFLIYVIQMDKWQALVACLISYGVWNAINDPIVGNLSDRTRTRWGRRRPYLLMGIPIMFVFGVLIWTPPLGGQPLAGQPSLSIFLYATLAVSIYEFGHTMVGLGHGAVFPEMWTDQKDRSEVTVYRESLSVIGGILAMLVFPLMWGSLSEQFGELGEWGGLTGWAWAGVIIMAIFSGAYLVTLLAITERKEFSEVDKPMPFITSLKTAITNKSWFTFKGAELMTTCMIDWISGISLSFVTFSLLMGVEAFEIMMGVQLVAMFAFFPIWRKICLRHGTKVTLAASMITFNIGPMLALVARDNLGIAIMGLLSGITIGGLTLSRALMWADVVDEDEIKTGVRREGMYSGVSSPFDKIAYIIVVTGMTLLLSFIGFDQSLASQPSAQLPSVGWGFRVGMAAVPPIFTAVMLVFLRSYPLGKKRVEEVGKEIEKLHAEKAKKLEEITAEAKTRETEN